MRDPGGALVGRVGADGVKYYYFDGLGSTVLIADSAGNVTDRYDYGAWGEQYVLQGTTSDNPYRYVGELGYYGYYQDPTLGLIQVGDRFYEPATGRYIMQRGMPYAFAMNNPTAVAEPPVQPSPTPVKPPPILPDGKVPPNIRPVVPAGGGASAGVGTGFGAAARVCVIAGGFIALCDLGYWAVTGKACGPFTQLGDWLGQQLWPGGGESMLPWEPKPKPKRPPGLSDCATLDAAGWEDTDFRTVDSEIKKEYEVVKIEKHPTYDGKGTHYTWHVRRKGKNRGDWKAVITAIEMPCIESNGTLGERWWIGEPH